jgi:RNA polymerase sigma factor (sigma-70 family)
MNILDSFPKTELDAKTEARMKPEDLSVAYMHEAVLYARACCASEIPDGELVSICYDAMMKTAKLFSPERGRFFAYCKPRIRGSLLRHWKTTMATVRNAEVVPELSTAVFLDEAPDSEIRDYDTPHSEPDFDSIGFRERWAEVSAILAKRCTDRERTIMQLVFSMHFTFEETGKVLGISRAAAQAIASKVIERVQKVLNV